MSTITLEVSEALLARLEERCAPGERIESLILEALEQWCDIGDARHERGAAFAVLIDEIGASARSELDLPNREKLNEWLRLLIVAIGARSDTN